MAAGCLWAAACLLASAQQYPFRLIPGSPKNVRTLFQDSRGRLWMGGSQVSCFDGSRFFSLRGYGFPPVESYAIAEDKSGAIWIGAETGVYRFSNGRVEEIAKGVAISVIAAAPNIAVAAIGPLGQGTSANTSLVRMKRSGNAWKAETILNLGSPSPLTLDPAGMLLYPSTTTDWDEIRLEDVIHWHPGKRLPVIHHGSPGLPLNGRWVVARDHSGCLWGGAPSAIFYNCGDGLHQAPFPGASLQAEIQETPDGRMLLWGNNLLAVGRPGSFQVATRANGLPGLTSAIQTRDGTIWLGTPDGLYRFASPFRIEYWTIREGLPDPPWSVARAGQRIYAGLDRRIVALNKDRSRWDTIARLENRGLVSGLLAGKDGTLFAASIEGGVTQLSPDGKVLARTEKGRPLSGSMRLTRTPGGEIWLGGTPFGRITRSGKILKFESHPLKAAPSGNVLAIKYEDHTRKLWACYHGGLVVRDEFGNWKEFTTRDGLRVNGCWSLAPLPNGDVWYAYYNVRAFALIRPEAGGGIRVRQYGPADGVPEPGDDTFDADRSGRLWRSGVVGIYVADPGQAEAGKWLKLDQSDGFPADGMNSGSVFVDSDGSLWWGADNDLTHYIPPPDLVSPRFSPRVFVSAFSWDNQPPRIAEVTDGVPRGVNAVAHIGSLQFDRRNALGLRYRVLPGHPSWTETASLDLPLGALSSGSHTLEVQGRVFTGPWSPAVSRVFVVLRPLWLTWPLLSLYFLAAAVLSAAGYLLYRRHAAEQAQVLPDLSAWRVGALLPDVHEVSGTVLDSRFEVGGLLARGGFASVMEGYDRILKNRCAVKVFRSEVKDSAWIQRGFEQEVAALRRVRHPNVVSIYAQGRTSSGAPYLVMEFIEGRSLREILENGPLSPGRTALLLGQLAAALDAIHSEGICHRDVKPENVIVRREVSGEEAVLIDFSIAIVKDANETLHGLSRAAGSFDYMAPEQAVGYAQPSSDIYSLAKVAIEMLTGRQLKVLLPEASLDLPEQVRKLARELKFSEESSEMLASALEFDPGRRPRAVILFARPLVRDMELFGAQHSL